MRGHKRGQTTGAQLPSKYKRDYIDLMSVILLNDKKADGEMWRAYKEDDAHRGSLAGNVISLDVAHWVSQYLKDLEPEEVDVKMLSGEMATMGMDAFKELIGGMKSTYE